MLSFLSVDDLLGGLNVTATATNDIWGWTDPVTGKEYALVGMNGATSFVDVSDPVNPAVIGVLPTSTRASVWRDVKVYADHAFIVADAAASHGMQVFDLTQLRSVASPPALFEETAVYSGFGSAHNIVINEETGFAYAVGSNSSGTTCGGGLHMINIQSPASPQFAGCFADAGTGRAGTGYTHDAQCVVYNGPDADYQGKELCFGSNETALSISDVSDKGNPVKVVAVSYPNVAYTHQGWLSEDHRYFFMDDELDERRGLIPTTRTIIWDLADVDDPIVADEYVAATSVIDHNLYVVGNYLYQSNYTSGVRILNIEDPTDPVEVAFFDVLPNDESMAFNGSWSNYPFFDSGILVATSIDEGLFVLEPALSAITASSVDEALPARVEIAAPYPNPFQLETAITLRLAQRQHVDIDVYDLLGRRLKVLFSGTLPANEAHRIHFERGDLPAGEYIVQARGNDFSKTHLVTIVR